MTSLYDRMLRHTFKAGHAGPVFGTIGALDTALWDIKAQAAGEPLWRLLGGRDRRVPAYASGLDIGLTDDELVAAYEVYAEPRPASGQAQGRPRHRARPAPPDAWSRDVLTEAGHGRRPGLMLDVNEAWTRKQAVRHVCELERTLDLIWIEEPVRRWDAEGLAVGQREACPRLGRHRREPHRARTVPSADRRRRGRHRPDGRGLGGHPLPAGRPPWPHAHDLPVSPIGNSPVGLLHAATSVPNHLASELQDLHPPVGCLHRPARRGRRLHPRRRTRARRPGGRGADPRRSPAGRTRRRPTAPTSGRSGPGDGCWPESTG